MENEYFKAWKNAQEPATLMSFISQTDTEKTQSVHLKTTKKNALQCWEWSFSYKKFLKHDLPTVFDLSSLMKNTALTDEY